MNVLSFVGWEGAHDTAAALACDGRVVAAAEEERFTRVKHDAAVPVRAIDWCLSQAGLTMRDVDLIAFPGKPFRTGPDSSLAVATSTTARRLHGAKHLRGRSVAHNIVLRAALRLSVPWPSRGMAPAVRRTLATVRDEYGPLPVIRFYDHHESHAAAAFLTSGLDHAAVVTVDGRGDAFSTVTWEGRNGRLHRLREEPFTNSLGVFYSDCTRYLRLGAFGEGKTMGLAPYGDPEVMAPVVERLLSAQGRRWYRYLRRPDAASVGFQPPAAPSQLTEAPYRDFAAAAQRALEVAIERIVASARADAGAQALCLGGGVTLNCSANGRLAGAAQGPVSLFPAAGDAGLAVGAALLGARDFGDEVGERIDHAYLGPSFLRAEAEAAVQAEPSVTVEQAGPLEDVVADLLATGNIVGWCRGRMEFGPRALGARSILADPRSREMHARVNEVKGREQWRPLAPSVLHSRAGEFFDLPCESPFMLLATRVHRAATKRIPATVHVDGTARPQTVRREQNPQMHALLEAFDRRAGVPVVLNTSFNAAGEPIVCTPSDAIRTFLATGLDALVLGDLLVRRNGTATG